MRTTRDFRSIVVIERIHPVDSLLCVIVDHDRNIVVSFAKFTTEADLAPNNVRIESILAREMGAEIALPSSVAIANGAFAEEVDVLVFAVYDELVVNSVPARIGGKVDPAVSTGIVDEVEDCFPEVQSQFQFL